jgi:hypothetical protein
MIGSSVKSSRCARIWEGRRLALALVATIAAGEAGRGQAVAPPIFGERSPLHFPNAPMMKFHKRTR